MASSGQQPEGFSMVDFDGKHGELVQKLSEISTSMRQCADIVDSFNQIVRHLSLRPTEIGFYRPTSAPNPSRRPGFPKVERPDAPSTAIHLEGSGMASATAEAYRRLSYPHLGGSMLPPAVPIYHSSSLPLNHPSTSSQIHNMPGPPSYPLQRPSGATSGPGPVGSHEASGVSPRTEAETIVPEHVSSHQQAKRKRIHPTDRAQPGDASDDDSGGSMRHESADVGSEDTVRISQRTAYGSEESSETSKMSSKGQPGAERTEERAEQAGGQSILVFASGTGRGRAPSARSQAQGSTSRARKEKKPRDPNAPKQPPPAYIMYQNEIRESMRARFPGHSPTELVKEIAATWKLLPNSERQRYKDNANVEKDRWVAELAAYQATLSTSDDQPAKSSEGSFLATAVVSDSPPISSPHQSPRMSDAEAQSHDVRRVASQDGLSGPATYSYAYQAPLRASSSFPGSIPGTSSPRGGTEGGPSYPPRLERPHSRLASSTFGSYGRASPLHMPSPGRTHLTELRPDSRGPPTRLPSFDSLGLGHSTLPAREVSPRPSREQDVEGEEEPASKRQRTRANPSEEGDGGSSHLTYDERKSE